MQHYQRRITALCMLMLFISSVALGKSKTIVIEKIDGNESNLWGSVTEYHEETADGGGHHRLRCSNPGNTLCYWTMAPRTMLVEYAEREIAAGNLSGTYSTVRQSITYHVEWSATDINNYLITETQQDINATPGIENSSESDLD